MSKKEYKNRMPRDRRPMIQIRAKYGTFRLNEVAVKFMDLHEGDGLVMEVDLMDSRDWSLIKKSDSSGCKLRKERVGYGLVFNSKAAAKGMHAALKDGDEMRYRILEQQDDGSYPLLTRVNLYKPQKSKSV